MRRFQREAQVTAGLRSPHTVQLYDFGVNDSGSFYYVMELLEGLDLHQIVTRFGPQPAERVTMLLRQACRSLAEAHEHGLVHRDIKPANLFVTRLGSEYDYLKVLDFGIVKDRPSQGRSAETLLTSGILQGTPAFMAPELVSGETHRWQDRPLLARVHGVSGADRTASLPGELPGADAPPPPADATGTTVRGLGASDSRRARGDPDDVSRKGSGGAAVIGARARIAACTHPMPGALDRGPSPRVVDDPRPGNHRPVGAVLLRIPLRRFTVTGIAGNLRRIRLDDRGGQAVCRRSVDCRRVVLGDDDVGERIAGFEQPVAVSTDEGVKEEVQPIPKDVNRGKVALHADGSGIMQRAG